MLSAAVTEQADIWGHLPLWSYSADVVNSQKDIGNNVGLGKYLLKCITELNWAVMRRVGC